MENIAQICDLTMLPSLVLQFSTPLRRLLPSRSAVFYEQTVGPTLLDLLFYFPTHLDERCMPAILTPDLHRQTLYCQAQILGYKNDFPHKIVSRAPFLILARFQPLWAQGIAHTKTLFGLEEARQVPNLNLVFFKGDIRALKHIFPLHTTVTLKGQVFFSPKTRTYSLIHPTLWHGEAEDLAESEVLYSLGARCKQPVFKALVEKALKIAPFVDEWIPQDLLQTFHWPSWNEALQRVHHPKVPPDLTLHNPARQRLVFDELLAKQLVLAKSRLQQECQAPPCPATPELASWRASLPFTLTESQKNAMEDIQRDLASPCPMLRLLQGDVGSGKTLVALAAALQVLRAGYQVAFLAPTDVLARQHFSTVQKYLPLAPSAMALAAGHPTPKQRQTWLEGARSGQLRLLVGTHALIQESVEFEHLGLAIIDEQHRFGVEQRLALFHKTQEKKEMSAHLGLHTLFLSATPIPRTLVLAQHGDMAVSTLTEKPAHRQKVESRVMSLKHVEKVLQSLERILAQKQQVYWVCPLVKESDRLDLTTVDQRFQSLEERFPGQVAVLHGQMKSDEKQRVMADFYAGKTLILVATTVIEIGVDAPNATVMVVEHAERFGLAQLHQLRGRVGRGHQASYCLFLYGDNMTPVAQQRLAIIRNFEDGFKIAEMDLSLRGGGDIFGTQQSGRLSLRLLPKLDTHDVLNETSEAQIYTRLLQQASLLAKSLVGSMDSLALQTLLFLFQKDVHDENIQLAG